MSIRYESNGKKDFVSMEQQKRIVGNILIEEQVVSKISAESKSSLSQNYLTAIDDLSKQKSQGREERKENLEMYNILMEAIRDCSGGCCRESKSSKPMFRPKNGYKFPSDIMVVLEQPNSTDDMYQGCLTIGPEDYVRGGPDPTARGLLDFFETIEVDYRDVFTTNSILCWQSNNPNWSNAWLPCLSRNWLTLTISLCLPKLIITFGGLALDSVLHTFGHKRHSGNLKDHVNNPIKLNEKYIYPLYHVSPNAQISRPMHIQRDDWKKLKRLVQALI